MVSRGRRWAGVMVLLGLVVLVVVAGRGLWLPLVGRKQDRVEEGVR